MNINTKSNKLIILILIITLLILIIFTGYSIYKKTTEYNDILNIKDLNTEEIQENIINIELLSDLYVDIDGNNAIAVITIDKIAYEGLVYEGTTAEILENGIGHFECSPILEGNVCIAGHNYSSIWGDLYKLEKGDLIEYNSILGEKNYEVFEIKEILETDLSILNDTNENILTLITCINNEPQKRLCVICKEKI